MSERDKDFEALVARWILAAILAISVAIFLSASMGCVTPGQPGPCGVVIDPKCCLGIPCYRNPEPTECERECQERCET